MLALMLVLARWPVEENESGSKMLEVRRDILRQTFLIVNGN